jgi:tetratricopeptide (TPR) repeat protein
MKTTKRKIIKSSFLFAGVISVLTLISVPALAQESPWQRSYRLETAGLYSEAISAIDQVSANSADAELKSLRRGWLYYLLGNYNESIREYRFSSERNSKSIDARLGITLPLLAQKRWREAEQNARAILAYAPNNYTALLRLILALEGQKNWDEMLKTSETLVALFPTDATAYVYQARSYAWLSKNDAAMVAYSAVLTRYPANTEALAYLQQK